MSQPGKHIVLLSLGFPRDEEDTTCIPALQDFVDALPGLMPGYRFTLMALHYPPQAKRYRWHGMDVHAFGSRSRPLPWSFWAIARLVARFRQLHRDNPVDLIHAFWLGDSTWVGLRLARYYGIRLLATILGRDALPCNRSHRRLKLDASEVVAISPRTAADYQRATGITPDHLIPWGLAPLALLPSGDGSGRDVDLVGVGHMYDLKRFDLWLEVLAELKRRRPGIRALLIGDGADRDQLEATAVERGLTENVRFTGRLPRPQVLEHMARAKILLHLSSYEGFGMVFLEALARGCAVVSTPVGIAEAGVSWRVGEDVPSLANHCMELLNTSPPNRPYYPYPLSDTLAAYEELYRQGTASTGREESPNLLTPDGNVG